MEFKYFYCHVSTAESYKLLSVIQPQLNNILVFSHQIWIDIFRQSISYEVWKWKGYVKVQDKY